MLEPVRVIISWDGDHIGRVVGRATLEDDVEEVRRVDQAINRGNECFKGWCLAAGGSIIEIGGDEGRVEVPIDALKDLPEVRHAYFTAVDATVTVGIGKKLSESAKALMAGKLRGGDKVVFYDEDVEAEVAAVKDKSEADKIGQEYLLKAGEGSAQNNPSGGVSAPHKAQPSMQTAEHSQGEVARDAAVSDVQPHPLLADFHGAAIGQDKADTAAAIQQSDDFQELKQQVATALTGLRTQLPVLAQMKTAYPDTYKAVTTLVQSVVGLARGLQTTDEKLTKAVLQKKEPKPQIFKENTGGFGTPVTIPGSLHPDRKAYDESYLNRVQQAYGGFDHKDIDISKLQAGNSGRGVINKDRYKLYHKMLSAGDTVPPVVVRQTPSGYQLVDGTHRLQAAVATKTKKLPALVLKNDLTKGIADIKPRGLAEVPGLSAKPPVVKFDYSHVLPKPIADKGYKLQVHFDRSYAKHGAPHGTLHSVLHDPEGYEVGHTKGHIVTHPEEASHFSAVSAYAGGVKPYQDGGHPEQKGIEPHSQLDDELQGQGIGSSMYSALYAHAYGQHGVRHVYGGVHSAAANRMHQRLASEHGFEIHGGQEDADGIRTMYPHDPYAYTLKDELSEHEQEHFEDPVFLLQAPVTKPLVKQGLPSESPHKMVSLPVGTLHNGKVKVKHADGKSGWKGVRAGMIQGQEAGAPLFGANSHPVSSREPGSK